MIDNISVTVMGDVKQLSQKTTYLELSKEYQNSFKK